MASGGPRRLSYWSGDAGRFDHSIINGIIQRLNFEWEGNERRHR